MFAQLIALLMLMQQMPQPGASGALMVTYQGQSFHQEFGHANDLPTGVAPNTLITSKTRMIIGSTSKQYTTTAIMKLEESGKLKTSDSITQWLPELTYKSVTIEQLMNHTSGIPDAYNQPLLQNKLYQSPITLKDFFKALKGKRLVTKPGTVFAYSNTNYVLLGEIIRRASGQRFSDYMRKTFFKPFGLNSTSAGLVTDTPQTTEKDLIAQNIALCYLPVDGERQNYLEAQGIQELHMQEFMADGNIVTTSEEIHQWTRLLMNGKLISKKSLQKMLTPASPASNYGYAWFIERDSENRLYYEHGGEWLGYQSHIRHYPELDLTITWISNQWEDASGIPVFVDQVAGALFTKP